MTVGSLCARHSFRDIAANKIDQVYAFLAFSFQQRETNNKQINIWWQRKIVIGLEIYGEYYFYRIVRRRCVHYIIFIQRQKKVKKEGI